MSRQECVLEAAKSNFNLMVKVSVDSGNFSSSSTADIVLMQTRVPFSGSKTKARIDSLNEIKDQACNKLLDWSVLLSNLGRLILDGTWRKAKKKDRTRRLYAKLCRSQSSKQPLPHWSAHDTEPNIESKGLRRVKIKHNRTRDMKLLKCLSVKVGVQRCAELQYPNLSWDTECARQLRFWSLEAWRLEDKACNGRCLGNPQSQTS